MSTAEPILAGVQFSSRIRTLNLPGIGAFAHETNLYRFRFRVPNLAIELDLEKTVRCPN